MRKLLIATLTLLLLAGSGVALAATTRTVRMDDIDFKPATLSVRSGDTVRFRNAESVPHDVRATRGPVRFASRVLRRGDVYRRKMTRRGSYTIVCTLHPGMRMNLRVR